MRELILRLWGLPLPRVVRWAAASLASQTPLLRLVAPRFFVGVVGIVRNENREVLLVRHTYRQRYPWGLPTGFLERGEQPAAALAREILEETGFECVIESTPAVYSDDQRPLLSIVFKGRYSSGSFTPNSEISEVGFFPLDRLPPLLPDQLMLLRNTWMENDARATP